MESTLRQSLITVAQAFASGEGCALSTVSRRCRNDSGFFHRLSDENKSFTARTFDEVMQWFSDNWPDDSDWPAAISRPDISITQSSSADSTAARVASSPETR